MPISKQHELICLHKHPKFFPSGAYSQIVEGKVQFQGDLSYSFEVDKEVPDLCIEVVICSANTDKVCKYQLRGIPEVWSWQENKSKLTIYKKVDMKSREKFDLSLI
ncbi:MAG: Uma2 family endonuclease [Pseudanabaenaceae cyanobacterium]